jgi:hypothetical protein
VPVKLLTRSCRMDNAGAKDLVRQVLCVLMFMSSVSRALAATINIVGPLTNPNIGDSFNIDVDVADITDLYAFQFDLTFDPALLSAVSVTEGAFLPGGGPTFLIPGAIDNIGGNVTATADSLIGSIPGVTGSGTLAVFQFTALAPGTSPLSFANEILLDSSLNDITADTTFQNGSVTINGASSVPEPRSFALLGASLLLLVLIHQRQYQCGTRRR